MKLIEISSCCRSGHHAIINWLSKNLVGDFYPPNIKIKQMPKYNMTYINEANFDQNEIKNYIAKSNIDKLEIFMLNYENDDPNFTLFSKDLRYKANYDFYYPNMKTPNDRIRILIIRDFYNNLASRIKLNSNYHSTKANKYFIELWKKHAYEVINNNTYYIKYEDWLLKPKTRKKFLNEIFKINEIYDIDIVPKENSSFDKIDYNSVMNRYKQVEIPDEIKNWIKNDNELHYLIGKLNYNFLNL